MQPRREQFPCKSISLWDTIKSYFYKKWKNENQAHKGTFAGKSIHRVRHINRVRWHILLSSLCGSIRTELQSDSKQRFLVIFRIELPPRASTSQTVVSSECGTEGDAMATPTASINVLSIRFSSCFSRIPRHNQKIATLIETRTYRRWGRRRFFSIVPRAAVPQVLSSRFSTEELPLFNVDRRSSTRPRCAASRREIYSIP